MTDPALRLAQIREQPTLSDIAAHFQREADECRATAAQIQKRIDGGYAFDGDVPTKAHYDRNAAYFQARADVITEAVAALARAEQTIREPQDETAHTELCATCGHGREFHNRAGSGECYRGLGEGRAIPRCQCETFMARSRPATGAPDPPIQWYPCACGAEHDTPRCPFGEGQATETKNDDAETAAAPPGDDPPPTGRGRRRAS